MLTQKISIVMIILSMAGFLMFNCAGTRGEKEPEFMSENNSQQDDLDDIEALLGITSSEESSQPAQQPQKQTKKEQLNLLEGNEVIAQQPVQQMSETEKKKYEQRISKLEEELNTKSREISSLKSELSAKETQLDNLSRQNVVSAPARSMTAVSSIAAEEYDMRYQEARNAFESKNYEAAIQYFESLMAASTTHNLADNAQYWIGESYYALRQYDAAIIAFEKVLTFPKSNKNIDAQFKIGLCYVRKGNKTKAAEEFGRLNADYPGNRFESKVNEILSKL